MAIKKENSKELIDLLRRMWLIRAFEEKVSALYAERQIIGLLHLGIGQEAVAVGALSLLRADDLRLWRPPLPRPRYRQGRGYK